MVAPILHHYDISAYSERVRLAMGLKGLQYCSVSIPPLMPKPDLTALTGGYRRAPVLQIGADIWCDTQVILRLLDRLQPEPTLFPAATGAMATALAWWADKSIFPPALGIVGNVNAGKIPPDFVAERKAFGFNLDPDDIAPHLPDQRDQASAQLDWLEQMLTDGRNWLLGEAPTAFDLAAHGSIWLLRRQGREAAAALLPPTRLDSWYRRVDEIGHGRPSPLDAAEALGIARDSEPQPIEAPGTTGDLAIGQRVTVTPNDTGLDPVAGTMVAATRQEIVIRRETDALGALHVHFPRAGFVVSPM